MTDERKDGRTRGRTDGWRGEADRKDGRQRDGLRLQWMDGRTYGLVELVLIDGQKDVRTVGRTDK